MGSFNTSCFVSRQTIAPGDPCLVTPIIQQSTYRPVELTYGEDKSQEYGVTSSTCYPTRFWRPVGSFFEAVYDDYGRVTLTDTSVNRFRLTDFLREALRSTPLVAQGENQYHDVPFYLAGFMAKETPELLAYLSAKRGDKVEFNSDLYFKQGVKCWDYIYEVAQEQRMFWRNYQGVLRPMNFSIMHRCAYEALIAQTNATIGWDKESYEMRAFFDRALATVKGRIAEMDAEASTDEDAAQRQRLRKFFAFDRFRDTLNRIGGAEGSSYPGEIHVYPELQDAYLEGKISEDRMFELIKPWLEIRYACSAMLNMNLHFEPVVYATQDFSNEIGALYAELVANVSAQVTRGRLLHSYGPLKDYCITVSTPDVLKPLGKHAREWDGALEVVSIRPDKAHPGFSRVAFACTLEPEDLGEMLASFSTDNTDHRILLDTLVVGQED